MRHTRKATYAVPEFSSEDAWKASGLCRSEGDPQWWFPEGRGKASQEAKAVAVCSRCPIRERCRAAALAAREIDGVWGAMTESELRKLVGKAGQ